MGVGDGTEPNVYGQKPWTNDDPLTPNEAYFRNVDAVVRMAGDNNLAISMTLYHQRYRQHITVNNARRWAKWLAGRYKDSPNIVWSMTPEARPEFVPVLRELAAGLHAGDGGPPPDDLQAGPRAVLLELHPRRAVARFRLDADVEGRRS